MCVRNLLTHSQKNFGYIRFSVHPEQIFANWAEGYRRTVLSRHVAKHRRRSDETLLRPISAGYICATSKSQLTRVDVHMKNGMAKPEMNGTQRAQASPRAGSHLLRAIVCASALTLLSATRSRSDQQGSGEAHLRSHRRSPGDRRAAHDDGGAEARMPPPSSPPRIRRSTTTPSATWRRPGPTAPRRCSRRSTTTPPPLSAWCATTCRSTPC